MAFPLITFLAFVKVLTILAVIPRTYYRRALTDITLIILMDGYQRVELLNNIIFSADAISFRRKTLGLVQKLTLADYSWFVERRSNSFSGLLGVYCLDSVSVVAVGNPNISFSNLIFLLSIPAKVVHFHSFNGRCFFLVITRVDAQLEPDQVFEKLQKVVVSCYKPSALAYLALLLFLKIVLTLEKFLLLDVLYVLEKI